MLHTPLVTHVLNCLPWWANEHNTGFSTFSSKGGVLAQLRRTRIVSHNSLFDSISPTPVINSGRSRMAQIRATHKPIAGVNTSTPFFLRNLNDTVAIQVGGDRT